MTSKSNILSRIDKLFDRAAEAERLANTTAHSNNYAMRQISESRINSALAAVDLLDADKLFEADMLLARCGVY